MPLKTLCGIFDEPIKTPKKNFIRENIKSIKQLQGILQEARRRKETSKSSFDRNQNSVKSRERISSVDRSKSNSRQDIQLQSSSERIQSTNNKSINKTLSSIDKMQNVTKLKGYKTRKSFSSGSKPQCSDRSVQTDPDFGSCDNLKPQPKNIQTIKPKGKGHSKEDTKQDSSELKGGFHCIKPTENEKSTQMILESQCPPGHTLLPEAERTETLKTLKQNYQKLIYQLNCLSLTHDTLRIKKRKIELEEDLKKIDDAIKIFDRSRVYVKQ